MDSEPPAETAPDRTPNWTWALIVAVWLLLFMVVLAVGAAVVFWRQAASAKYAVAAITTEYQNLNDQLTASDAKVAILTKDRSALVDQLAATNKQLAAAPNAALAKLTSERNALADQLTNTNANLAKLTADRDALAQRLAATQVAQIAVPNAPAQPPVAPHKRGGRQPGIANPLPAPALPAVDNQPLTMRLDAEFQAILPTDPQRSSILEAARLFEGTDLAAHWTDYLRALEIIREHRSKAAIPLLMKYALQQSRFNGNSSHQFSDAITILTGQEIFLGDVRGPDTSQCEAAIKKFFEDWYLKNKAAITVDPARMTDDQRKAIVAALLRSSEEATRNDHSSMGIAYEANMNIRYHLMEYVKDPKSHGRVSFYPADLCPALVPFLLESAGWSSNPQVAPPQIPATLPVDVIPMLAVLRKNGGAPELSKIAADPLQPNAARLTCLLALHTSGEAISADPLIAIATQEKTLEIRVYAITALQYTAARNVPAKLVEFLGDPNEEIVAAACWALQTNPTPDAVASLKKIIDDGTLKSAMLPALGALGKIKSFASADALANFLAAKMQNATTLDSYAYYAIDAFYEATGCPRKAGPLKVQDVTDALNWWNANKAHAKR